MKKIKLLFFITIISVFILSCIVYAEEKENIKIMVNGDYLISDVSPIIVNNRILVPVRIIIEAFNGEIIWNPEEKQIIIYCINNEIVLTIDNEKALLNGKEIFLETPATIINDRIFIPIRFISENIGLVINFDAKSNTVSVHFPSDQKVSKVDNADLNKKNLLIKDNFTLTSPIKRNEIATLNFIGKPNTEYNINVFYKSGKSSAEGLENKISDENGNVSWSWSIGGRTSFGDYKIVVSDGNENFEITISIRE